MLDAGAVGINLEDSLEEGGPLRLVEDQCQRIARVRETSIHRGVHLVINARVDSFLSSMFTTQEGRIEEAVARARVYAQAGADCIYPIGPGGRETLAILRERITSPLNILASPAAEPLTTLQQMGINRVSFGPFVFRSCLRKFERIIEDLRDLGGYECFAQDMMSGDEIRQFLRQESE